MGIIQKIRGPRPDPNPEETQAKHEDRLRRYTDALHEGRLYKARFIGRRLSPKDRLGPLSDALEHWRATEYEYGPNKYPFAKCIATAYFVPVDDRVYRSQSLAKLVRRTQGRMEREEAKEEFAQTLRDIHGWSGDIRQWDW
ncbi:MAG: hypothetical protein KGH72_03355 [Candidatus Micrarchaeota archaeon]|nr:hypothetical protein [Candidatus Micrarchaeota archaeon]